MTVVSTTGESEISKPLTDKRLYRRVELANGMVVLLISDPDMNTDDTDADGSPSGGGTRRSRSKTWTIHLSSIALSE